MDFPVYFYERELEKFLRVTDTTECNKDLQTAYATLMTQVKSGFGGALEVVTPELIEEFRFHTERKLKKEKKRYTYGTTHEPMPQFRTRIWLTCLRDELAALGRFVEIKKETEECERETVFTEDLTDSELDAAIDRHEQKLACLRQLRERVVARRARQEEGEQPFTDRATQQQITNTVSLFREYLESIPREAFTKLYFWTTTSTWSYTFALSDFQAWTLGYTESGIKHDMGDEEGLLFEHYLLFDIGCKNSYDAEMSNTYARVCRSI